MTTVTRDDDSQNIYTVPVEWCNQQKSVEESNNAGKRKNVLIVPGESISKKELRKISGRKKCAYTVFLVHLPYSINKPIRMHVLYRPCHKYCIIWVMDMRQNISSGISKSLFWKFRIKVRCASDVIFFWDITEKKTKKYAIIILRNGIHTRRIIYFGMCHIIQLCDCYYKRRIRTIIVLP